MTYRAACWFLVALLISGAHGAGLIAEEAPIEGIELPKLKTPLIETDLARPDCHGLFLRMETDRTTDGWPHWWFFKAETAAMRDRVREINRRNEFFATKFAALGRAITAERDAFRASDHPTRAEREAYLRRIDKLRVQVKEALGEWENTVRAAAVTWQTDMIELLEGIEQAMQDPQQEILRRQRAELLTVRRGDTASHLLVETAAGHFEETAADHVGSGTYRIEGAPARIVLPGAARLECAADSEVGLGWLMIREATTSLSTLAVDLGRGAIRFTRDVNRRRLQYRIRTSACAIGVRGTDFVVIDDGRGNVQLSVLDGSVRVEPDHSPEPIVVEAGEHLALSAAGSRVQPREVASMEAAWRGRVRVGHEEGGGRSAILLLIGLLAVLALAVAAFARGRKRSA